jgi:lysozyme
MKTGNKGIELIKDFEGFRGKKYLCAANMPTIGYGHVILKGEERFNTATISEIEGVQLLAKDLFKFEAHVKRMVKRTLTQNQFDALVSFCYNCGPANLERSTLLKKVNLNPNDKSIALEFMKWTRANGKVLAGLERRRKAEAGLYFS